MSLNGDEIITWNRVEFSTHNYYLTIFSIISNATNRLIVQGSRVIIARPSKISLDW